MPEIKVFTANLGFYETAVAARSQKMALAHWGVTRDIFHEGTAKESNEPKAVEAAMRKVGMVVRRPIGSSGAFEERAEAERTLLKALSRARKAVKPAKKKADGKKNVRKKR
jgi:colicin import membrane protein